MSTNLFKTASIIKLRFSTNKGSLSVEDLWDLSLTSLDTIAKSVSRQLKAESEESFIAVKTSSNTQLEIALEILKIVIADKLAQKAASLEKQDNLNRLSVLQGLVDRKKNESLEGLSIEELQAQIDSLQA
jgi:hypothetical protein